MEDNPYEKLFLESLGYQDFGILMQETKSIIIQKLGSLQVKSFQLRPWSEIWNLRFCRHKNFNIKEPQYHSDFWRSLNVEIKEL